MRTPRTIYLGEEDYENIALLKERFGVTTDAETIRLALRLAVKTPKPRKKKQLDDVPGESQIL